MTNNKDPGSATLKFKVLDESRVLRFHWLLDTLASLGPFVDALNEFGGAVALSVLAIIFHLTPIETAITLGGYWIGVGIGAMVIGALSDMYGRRFIFVWDMLFVGIVAIASALVFNAIQFFITRFLLGLVIGADYTAAVPLMSEYAPVHSRGRLLGYQKIWFITGHIVALGLGTALAFIPIIGPKSAWRFVFIAAAIPAFALYFLRKSMPESIRWAVLLGRKKEAEEANSMLRKYGLEVDLSNVNFEYKRLRFRDVYGEFFSRKNLRAVLYVFWVGTAYALSVNLIAWMPYYLEQFHIAPTLSLLISFLSSFGNFAGIVLVTLTLDKLGRKTWGVLGLGLTSIPMLLLFFGVLYHVLTLPEITALFAAYGFINVGAVGTLQYVPAAEVTSTRTRGLSVGWDKLWEFVMAEPAFMIYAILGTLYAPLFVAIFSIVAGIILYFLAIETTGKSLEEIAGE